MARKSLSISFLLLVLPLFSVAAQSTHRQAHARRRHHHHARQGALPTETFASVSTSDVTGGAVEPDIQGIEKGLNALPQDLLAFITALEQRLQQVEAALEGLLPHNLPSAPQITQVPAPSRAPGPQSTLDNGSNNTVSVEAPPSTSHTTIRSTRTITQTIHHTFTVQISIPTGTVLNQTNVTTSLLATAPTVPSATPALEMPSTQRDAPTAYKFRADSQANVAVYYGQSPNTSAGGLLALCRDPNVDIVNLAFLYDFFTRGGYPSVDFGAACDPPRSAQAATAPGLLDCSHLGTEISQCQDIGKKILVSLGGYNANTSFASDAQAVQFAKTLWNLFGAGYNDDHLLRPFGPGVVVDGFDFDTEQKNPAHYGAFATALKQRFKMDRSQRYYLSAAPQCPMPDASIPMEVLLQTDFVYVQFYNNPSCNLNESGFQSSFARWSKSLTKSSTPGSPRLYIGAAAFPGAGSGYVPGGELQSLVSLVRELNVKNLGGMMLWDGSAGMENVDQYGDDYTYYAKAALE